VQNVGGPRLYNSMRFEKGFCLYSTDWLLKIHMQKPSKAEY
jgi:hypothetical protein